MAQCPATNSSWAVASPHRAASDAAARIFQEGGNAVDAALAAAVTLTVVYPNQCSVGGDVIALVSTPDGTVHAVNGSGRSARAMSADFLAPGATTMPVDGPFAVTVPGAVAAWHTMAERWGTAPISRSLSRGAQLAEEGVPVAPGLARDIDREEHRIRADAGLAQVLCPHGALLPKGAMLKQPALAHTLNAVATGGTETFYRGDPASSIVATLRDLGSPMTTQDFADHRTQIGESLSTLYAGDEYLSAPPNTQGVFFLEGLAALEIIRQTYGRDLDPLGADAPIIASILSAAARDRDTFLGDPDDTDIDLEELLGDRPLRLAEAAIARTLAPDRSATTSGSGDTVAIVTADGEGRWVSLIQSNFHAFGSAILDPESGVVLHNRGASFSLTPHSPNRLAGGRRPIHTLMPVLVRRSGKIIGSHGTMGGRAQPQIHTQVALHLAAGDSPEQAVGRPRWILGPMEAGGGDASPLDTVKAETGVHPTTQNAFLTHHFTVTPLPDHDDGAGHTQLVRATPTGLHAATDPRADGAAYAEGTDAPIGCQAALSHLR